MDVTTAQPPTPSSQGEFAPSPTLVQGSQSPKSKVFLMILLAVFLILILLLLIVGYFWWKQQTSSTRRAAYNPESSYTPIVAQETAQTIPTSWKTYEHVDGFSFQYPADWIIGTGVAPVRTTTVCIGSDPRYIQFYCENNTSQDPPQIGFKSTFIGIDTYIEIPADTIPAEALTLESGRETLPLVDWQYLTINELPAYRTLRESTVGQVKRTDVEYTYFYNSRLYRFWFEIDNNSPLEIIKTIDQAANTVTIK